MKSVTLPMLGSFLQGFKNPTKLYIQTKGSKDMIILINCKALYSLTTITSVTASADATVATATATRTMTRSRRWTLKTPKYGYFWNLWSECEVSWGFGKLSASRTTWHCHWLHDSIDSRFFVFQSEMINLQTSISGCGRRTGEPSALCHPRRPPSPPIWIASGGSGCLLKACSW